MPTVADHQVNQPQTDRRRRGLSGLLYIAMVLGAFRNASTRVALVVIGASDMVSGNIRTSMVQLATPDAMRGRVSAVNMLFIGASGELGAFESGVVAALFGPVESVVPGGIGTLFVAAVWMAAFPALRKAESVHPILHPTLTKV
jgi:hypothetical protein